MRSWIARVGKLKWGHTDDPKLIEDHVDEVALPEDSAAERAAGARVQNQFPEQRQDIDHTAVTRE
jgi:hypothetical protein